MGREEFLMTGMTGIGSAPRPRDGRGRLALGGVGGAFGVADPPLVRGVGQGGHLTSVPPAADWGADTTRQWPVRDFFELGALPGAVPSARLHSRQVIWEWGLAPISEQVEQVVSELIANSVAAARAMPRAEPVRLWLLSDTRKVLVLVWDASPLLPTLVEADEYAESGRGLFLVEAFSERWGAYPTPQRGGKVVWALCGITSGQ